VGIAACGGGGSSTESSSETATTTSGETTEITDTSSISGTVKVWDLNYKTYPDYTKAADELDAEFEEQNPGVTVDHIAQPFANYEQILQTAFTGHEGPDVMMLVGGKQGVLRWTEGLEPLNENISPEMQEELIGWNGATAGWTDEGEHFGVPVGLQGVVFYYNKKLFAKAGLPTDFQPKTWPEVKEAGEKLKKIGAEPFTGGDKEGYENQWWFSAGWQTVNTQKQAIELAEGEASFTDEPVEKAFEPEMMMQEAGLFPEDRFTTPLFPDGAARFGEGNAGMFLGLWSTAGYYGEYIPKLGEKNVGVFFPPGSKYIGMGPEYVWSIPSFAKNKEAAWAYIEFLASKQGVEKVADVGGALPNRRDVELPAGSPVQAEELVEATRENETFPEVHQMIPGAVLTDLSTEMNEVLQGREPLSDAQSALQEAAEKSAE
jgi:multiple sugar transport system substrate-binding protein